MRKHRTKHGEIRSVGGGPKVMLVVLAIFALLVTILAPRPAPLAPRPSALDPRPSTLDPAPTPLALCPSPLAAVDTMIEEEDPSADSDIAQRPECDPSTAAALATRESDPALRQQAIEQAAVAWANRDLSAAAQWVESLADDADRQVATMAVAYEAARTEPLTSLELAGALPASPERDDALVHAVSQWAAADSSEACAWATQVDDTKLRGRLLAAIAVGSAEKDAASAAALVAGALPPGEEQDRAAVSVVQRWAQNSPAEAAAWVAQFPESSAREAAAQNLLGLWMARDETAAAEWAARHPEIVRPQ